MSTQDLTKIKRSLRWAVKLGLDAEKMFWNDIADFGKRSDPFSI